MRTLVLLAVLLAPTLARAEMFSIKVSSLTLKTAGGKPAEGAIHLAPASYACNLDGVRPGKKKFTVWLDGSLREGSRKLETQDRERGGAPAPVVSCARLVVVNSKFHAAPGDYRATAVVTFTRAK